MRILDPVRKHEYILEADRSARKPTKFILRRLTRDEMFDYGARSSFTVEQAAKVTEINALLKKEKRAMNETELAIFDSLKLKSFEDVRRAIDAYAFAISCSLEEIIGLQNEKGAPVKMEPELFLKFAAPNVLAELGQFVMEISSLTEGERKN